MDRVRLAFVLGVSLTIVLVGCGGEDAPSHPAVRRDSAGILIIENQARISEIPTAPLRSPPVLALGVLEGDPAQQFNTIVGAYRLGDGTLVVGDQGSREIRLFDRNGRHLKTVGGRGGGPGEFSMLASLDRIRGDTLVASDWPIGTLSWFASSGEYIDGTRIGPYWPGISGRVLADGSLLADIYPGGSHGDELESWAVLGTVPEFRPRGYLVRVSRDGRHVDTLSAVAGDQWFKSGQPRVSLVVRPMPFARTTKLAWTAEEVFLGDTGRPEIVVVDYTGRVRRIIRWVANVPAVTERDREAYEEETMESLRQPERAADYRRWLAEVPYSEHKPAFRSLLADDGGRLWIQMWDSGRSSAWLVFSADGTLERLVTGPPGLELFDIDAGYAVGVAKDSLDLEYVRIYRLAS